MGSGWPIQTSWRRRGVTRRSICRSAAANGVLDSENRRVRHAVGWIEEESDFRDLKTAWNQLSEECDREAFFLRHEWFEAAWAWLRSSAWLRILCVHRSDTLIGICPLMQRATAANGRCLEFLSIPDTQECQIIAKADDLDFVLAQLVRALVLRRGQWDRLKLSLLPDRYRRQPRLARSLQKTGLRYKFGDDGGNPRICLDHPWARFYGDRSRRLKKGNNLAANRLARAGTVTLDWIRGLDNGADQERILNDVIGLSEKSWKVETGLTLDNPGPKAFIRTLTRHAAENGWLSLFLLRLDGQPIAMEYQVVFRSRVHALRADFDRSYADLSPGAFLNWKLLERLFASPASEYLMGPGNNAYKQRWTDETVPLWRVVVYSPTVRGYVIHGWYELLRPLIGRLWNRVRFITNRTKESTPE